MQIIQQYPVKVFKNIYQDKTYYRIGLSKKDQNGNYINGAIDAHFRNDAEVDDSKKIYIQEAWLDFYVKDKITHPYIFINKFEQRFFLIFITLALPGFNFYIVHVDV